MPELTLLGAVGPTSRGVSVTRTERAVCGIAGIPDLRSPPLKAGLERDQQALAAAD